MNHFAIRTPDIPDTVFRGECRLHNTPGSQRLCYECRCSKWRELAKGYVPILQFETWELPELLEFMEAEHMRIEIESADCISVDNYERTFVREQQGCRNDLSSQ
jgi:hypothetical protein